MLNRDELKTTSQAIDKIHLLCVQETKKGSQLLAEVGVLFQCIRCGLFLSMCTHCRPRMLHIMPVPP